MEEQETKLVKKETGNVMDLLYIYKNNKELPVVYPVT